MEGLEPGEYVITADRRPLPSTQPGQAATKPSPQDVLTYYPNAADLTGATLLRVDASNVTNGKDIILRRAVAVKVSGAVDKPQDVRIRLWPAELPISSAPERATSPNASDGSFEFDAIQPGKYRIVAFVPDRTLFADAQIDVTSADLTGVRLVMKVSPAVDGRLILEGDRKVPIGGIAVFLNPVDSIPGMRRIFAESAESGQFRIEHVPAGEYAVYVPQLPERTVMAEVRIGTEPAGADNHIRVREGETRPLDIAISTHAGSLAGTVRAATGSPAAGAVVITRSVAEPIQYFREVTDRDGRFLERNLAPGRYLVYPFEDYDPSVLTSSAGIAKYDRFGQQIIIKEGERQESPFKLIPASANR